MRCLALTVLVLLSLFSVKALAIINLSEVDLGCKEDLFCNDFSIKISKITGEYDSVDALKNRLKFFLFDESIKGLQFSLLCDQKKECKLVLNFEFRKVVQKVLVSYDNSFFDSVEFANIIRHKQGDFLNEKILQADNKKITNILYDKGFRSAVVNSDFLKIEGINTLRVFVKSGPPTIIEKISVQSSDKKITRSLERRFKAFKNIPLDITAMKLEVDLLSEELLDKGYFYSKAVLLPINVNKKTLKVNPIVKLDLGKRYIFGFYGNKVVSRADLYSIVKKTVRKRNEVGVEKNFQNIITRYYQKLGYFNTKVSFRFLKEKSDVKRFFFDINEGHRVFLDEIVFHNNKFLTDEYIKEAYFKKATSLAYRNLYDEKYAENFKDELRKIYISQGFIFAKVKLKKINVDFKKKSTSLHYFIDEGSQSQVRDVVFKGIPSNYQNDLLAKLKNQAGHTFNPLAVDQDIQMIINNLKNRGFLFARVVASKGKNIVKYEQDYKQVTLSFDVLLGNRVFVKDIITSGNLKTKNRVILREAFFKKDEPLSKKELDAFVTRLNNLRLFSNISVVYLRSNNIREDEEKIKNETVNLLVKVKEKKFGFFEIAPGFRTDIGLKLSSAVGYNNFSGLNRTVKFQGQVNQRLNFNTLDSRRRAEEKKRLEYDLRLSLTEPYLFKNHLTWQSTLSNSERRFFSFDARIGRLNTSLNKDWNEHFSTKLSYQLEVINQTDATRSIDEGFFRIGGLTPGFALDFRDNPVNPEKGVYLNWSVEIANPAFFSLKKEDLEINFYKLVLRNKFYWPVPTGVLALSAAFGVQKNLADENGLIPSIKVFRLNGVDLVRGFDDDEINRIHTGQDINDLAITDKAYFTAFRLEHRHYLNDDLILGAFLDGGRLYVNSFTPHSFRSSVGLSLKYMTPVGSLDFDYGRKLHRKRLGDGSLEPPGRFHVSIGFF